MGSLKRPLRRVLERLGYSVHRWPTNRFDGMQDALLLLRRSGYSPRVIVDGGANVGNWTRMARSVFHDATMHLVEPQPACRGALDDLSRRTPGLTVHPVALTEPGIHRVRIVGGGETGGGTGGRVARPGEREAGAVECPAITLDGLLADRVVREDRTLLKLDLEGHELTALQGARQLLNMVEVLLTELQFFDINDEGFPVFADVVGFLRTRGFEPYDFACLLQRPRDLRLCMGDMVFVRWDSALLADRSWK
jgi:FkbM family methyltransferase